MLSVTSLTHPTMINKIRAGLQYALMGQGHRMNGHGNRVYIQNAQGRNIMRLDWIGNGNYIVYGEESRTITAMVKQALKIASELEAKARLLDKAGISTPATEQSVEQAKAFIESNPDLKARLAKLAALAGMGAMLTACSNHGAITSVFTVLDSLFK